MHQIKSRQPTHRKFSKRERRALGHNLGELRSETSTHIHRSPLVRRRRVTRGDLFGLSDVRSASNKGGDCRGGGPMDVGWYNYNYEFLMSHIQFIPIKMENQKVRNTIFQVFSKTWKFQQIFRTKIQIQCKFLPHLVKIESYFIGNRLYAPRCFVSIKLCL